MILAAAAALVACSKNEVIPEVVNNDVETEITYLTAPKVRADVKDFDKNWNFKSYAFYLPGTLSWASHEGTDPVAYISDVEISYNQTDNVWRNETTKYYWPKSGKLTFFAWTNVREQRGVSGTTYSFSSDDYIEGVTVDATSGVKITDYDVTYVNSTTGVGNKNTDVLVADIKADQTKNLDSSYGTADKRTDAGKFTGVATLFKHKLSKVYFTGKTDKDYTADSIKFYVNSIVFNKVDKKGTYTQGVNASDCTGSWNTVENTADAQYYFSGLDGVSGYTIPSDKTVEDIYNKDSQYYYMPQTFDDDAEFVVTYSIDYGNGVKEENIKQVCQLNKSFTGFEIGKFYTINLIFTLNEILWDPAVEDWTLGTADVTINK